MQRQPIVVAAVVCVWPCGPPCVVGPVGVGPDPAVRVGGGREAAVGLEAGLKGGVQAGAARLEGVAHDVAALADLDG